jgi:hypothetical protein
VYCALLPQRALDAVVFLNGRLSRVQVARALEGLSASERRCMPVAKRSRFMSGSKCLASMSKPSAPLGPRL